MPDQEIPGVMGFPGGSNGKESACSVGDLGLIPGLGRSPGEGKGYPLGILAWRILWTEEPGRPMGLQRVRGLSDFHFCLFSSSFSIFILKKNDSYIYVFKMNNTRI